MKGLKGRIKLIMNPASYIKEEELRLFFVASRGHLLPPNQIASNSRSNSIQLNWPKFRKCLGTRRVGSNYLRWNY